MPYTCANCGTAIGALEQPYQWGDSVVCGPCVARLQAAPATSEAEQDPWAAAQSTASTQVAPSRKLKMKANGPAIICPNPNCGYRGKSHKKAKGSKVMAILLFCIMLLPGLLYVIFFSGYTLICPACGVKVRDA